MEYQVLVSSYYNNQCLFQMTQVPVEAEPQTQFLRARMQQFAYNMILVDSLITIAPITEVIPLP